MSIATNLIITLILIALIVLVQLFLSRQKAKWPGLILPIIFFLCSIIFPLNMAAPPDGTTPTFILKMVLALSLANIPTLILILIYASSRRKIALACKE